MWEEECVATCSREWCCPAAGVMFVQAGELPPSTRYLWDPTSGHWLFVFDSSACMCVCACAHMCLRACVCVCVCVGVSACGLSYVGGGEGALFLRDNFERQTRRGTRRHW